MLLLLLLLHCCSSYYCSSRPVFRRCFAVSGQGLGAPLPACESPKVNTAVCSWCVTKGRRWLLLVTLKFNGGCKGLALRKGEHHQKVDAAGSTGALKCVVMLID